ncbi:MAG TPA: SMI1/KNR4 family protein [Candidatus Angelobacter sp.]|nr:SMI1/KNR4 family protein [Candidatus Angelobacter sp.]
MTHELNRAYVIHALQRLKRSNVKMFGSDAHQFLLKPCLSLREISEFESNHEIVLPEDYRKFISGVGNGGAGPAYGFFPLGCMDAAIGEGFRAWRENDGLMGDLSEAFAFNAPWNDLSGMPAWNGGESENESYEKARDEFDRRYWSSTLMNGAIPVCHLGCALRVWLAVSGAEAGNLWYDYRADYRGLLPVALKGGSRATFTSWYSEWLEENLALLGPAKV